MPERGGNLDGVLRLFDLQVWIVWYLSLGFELIKVIACYVS
jgi:hypothetical protein